jgi:hypothetical protein
MVFEEDASTSYFEELDGPAEATTAGIGLAEDRGDVQRGA